MKQPFTKEEEEIMNLITQTWNKFIKLERGHPMEVTEFIDGIHKLQSIMSHRCLKRIFPEYFK